MTSYEPTSGYNAWELAERIDKSVDIVSRQEDTIDFQDRQIYTKIDSAEQNILDAIEALKRDFVRISDDQIDALFPEETTP
jgi:hypothetical protein